MFKSNSISEWVDYIQTLHVREIDLSLERVRKVTLALYADMCPQGRPFKVISVAGTNGKGSTCEIIASIYRAANIKVGKFSSPHLVRFNERFSIDGFDANDHQLLDAFKTVESARGDTPITYFEYGFLLAIALFLNEKVDVAVMEVGLGGRLDAVNVLDADVAVITSIALDHTAWLGDTLDEIAFEKSGIARNFKPCVVGVREPQQSMLDHLNNIDAKQVLIGKHFDFTGLIKDAKSQVAPSWSYDAEGLTLKELPLPFGQAGVQLSNASLAIAAVEQLGNDINVEDHHYRTGLDRAKLAGRCQLISSKPFVVLDVSHNEASIKRLNEFIESLDVAGQVIAVCGMLQDKQIVASLSRILSSVSQWHLATISGERGSSAAQINACLEQACNASGAGKPDLIALHDNAVKAYNKANETLTSDDCLLVFGSFYVVGDIISLLESS